MVFLLMITITDELPSIKSYQGYDTIKFWFYFFSSTIGGAFLNGATFWCTIKNSALTTR
jgi:hypothetical protein